MNEYGEDMKLGLEVEYWVVDESGALCNGHDLTRGREHVEPEFVGPMIEVTTPPVRDESELGAELYRVLRDLLDGAEKRGKQLVPLGTPLTCGRYPAVTERGKVLERIYGDGIEYAKHCAGTHVHFDRRNATRQLNLLTALDPALALVSSSPYYDGRRLASCSRAAVYRSETGREFSRYRDLWAYTIDADEWEGRVYREFETFRSIAADRGISAAAFERWFEPENTVLTPVRLRRRAPTIEWRAPDAALPSQILGLVGDVARLVRQTDHKPVEFGAPGVHPDRIVVPEFEALRGIVERSIAVGLRSPAVREYLESMTFDTGRYRPITEEIAGPPRIDERTACAIRLEYASRLRDDVDALADVEGKTTG